MALTKNPAPLAAGRAWNVLVVWVSMPRFLPEIASILQAAFAMDPAAIVALGAILVGGLRQ